MRPFKYVRASDPNAAARAVAANPQAKFLAGGTNLLDLMKEDVERPNELVDLTRLKLAEIKPARGGVSIGALATNTDTANHPLIRQQLPAPDAGHCRGRLRAAPQHGDQRREPLAAHALPVLLRHGDAVQQTGAWDGLRRPRRAQPDSRHPRLEREVRRHLPGRHGERALRARRRREGQGRGRAGAHDPRRASSTACRATRRRKTPTSSTASSSWPSSCPSPTSRRTPIT